MCACIPLLTLVLCCADSCTEKGVTGSRLYKVSMEDLKKMGVKCVEAVRCVGGVRCAGRSEVCWEE